MSLSFVRVSHNHRDTFSVSVQGFLPRPVLPKISEQGQLRIVDQIVQQQLEQGL